MTISVLIVSPQTNLGGLIRQGLGSDQLDFFETADFSEAIRYVRKNGCPLAILDGELEDIDITLIDVGYALQQVKPDINFIFFLRPGQEINTGRLTPIALLTKPLSIPDMQKAIAKGIPSFTEAATTNKDSSRPGSPIPERVLAETSQMMWLKDVSKAAQHLTRLTLESSAQAALITHQNELWAYAGQLSREAAEELARSIQRYWDNQSQSDLLRFVRLQSTEAQHMLYATKLSSNMILALVFDAETPFSTIRSQAGKLVRTLAEGDFDDESGNPASEAQLGGEGEFEGENLPPISDLLGEVPPPIPAPDGKTTAKLIWPWDEKPAEGAPEKSVESFQPFKPPKKPEPAQFSQESSPAVPSNIYNQDSNTQPGKEDKTVRETDLDLQDLEKTRAHVRSDMAETRKQGQEEDEQAMIETRPSGAETTGEVAHRILLEPASPALVNLTYACLLIPRFDTHHLIGDIADRVADWIPQVCVAFGWRLEFFAIRPEYLQWVVRVPPSTAPGYIMRIVRQQTSEKIFHEFPRYKKENPSGDFWAPGYLIMGSSQSHPPKLVRDFIRQTRQRQGIDRH